MSEFWNLENVEDLKFYFFPSAIFSESDSFLNLISDIIPKIGPKTKKVNPKVQPINSTMIGKSQIEIFEKAKPNDVWIAKVVPIYAGSDNSEIIAEYWGESGTTVSPQITAITKAKTWFCKKNPIIIRIKFYAKGIIYFYEKEESVTITFLIQL